MQPPWRMSSLPALLWLAYSVLQWSACEMHLVSPEQFLGAKQLLYSVSTFPFEYILVVVIAFGTISFVWYFNVVKNDHVSLFTNEARCYEDDLNWNSLLFHDEVSLRQQARFSAEQLQWWWGSCQEESLGSWAVDCILHSRGKTLSGRLEVKRPLFANV